MSLVLPDLSIRPNPSNPSTTIHFTLPSDTRLTLVIVDALGRPVARLIDADFPSGQHHTYFDAQSLPSGTYTAVLTTLLGSSTARLIVAR